MKVSADSIALLYRTGKITIEGVRKAFKRGWITEDEFCDITGETE